MPPHPLTIARRRNQGLCLTCGTRLKDKKLLKCEVCRSKNAQSVKKYKMTEKGRFYDREYHKRYARTHPQIPFGVKLRQKIVMLLGGKCVRCGFTDIRALQIDHIHGGGFKESSKFKNTYDYYKYVISNLDSEVYQILCANCNWIKRAENKEYHLNNARALVTPTRIASSQYVWP